MNKQLNGVVQGVGDKYNGSLKVGGEWFGFASKKHDTFKAGDVVTLDLVSWEAKGKTGFNISGVSIKEQPKTDNAKMNEAVKAAKDETAKPDKAYVGRDFDAENRGKVRHGLTVALVPLLAQSVIDEVQLKEMVSKLVDFVMKGE